VFRSNAERRPQTDIDREHAADPDDGPEYVQGEGDGGHERAPDSRDDVANIGSVHVGRRKRSNPLAVLIFLLGLGILAAAIVKSRMTGLSVDSRDRERPGV